MSRRRAESSQGYQPAPRSKAAAARSAQKLSAVRRWCKRSFVVVFSGALLAGVYLMGSELLHKFMHRPVEQVSVEGPFHYVSRERAMEIISLAINDEFVKLDIGQLKQTLENENWIERATVSRQWPNGMNIAIEEQVPIARWGESSFLNQRGEVIEVGGVEQLSELPWLFGRKRDSEKIMQQYQEIGKLLRSRNLALEKLHIDDKGTWRLTLKGGVRLVLGDHDVLEKMQRFFYIYDHYLVDAFAAVVAVDLRYTNGLAVSWDEEYEVVVEGAG